MAERCNCHNCITRRNMSDLAFDRLKKLKAMPQEFRETPAFFWWPRIDPASKRLRWGFVTVREKTQTGYQPSFFTWPSRWFCVYEIVPRNPFAQKAGVA
jgi:hypothetical protein